MEKITYKQLKLLAGRYFLSEVWKRETPETTGWLSRAWHSLIRIFMITGRGYLSDRCGLNASALTYITLVSLVPILAIMLSFCKGIGMQNKLLASIGMEAVTEYRVVDGHRQKEVTFRIIGQDKISAVSVGEADEEEEEEKIVHNADYETDDGGSVQSAEGEAEEASPEKSKKPTSLIKMLPEPMQMAVVNLLVYVEKTNFAALGLVGFVALLVTVVTSIRKLENNFNAIWNVRKGRPIARQFTEYIVLLLVIPIILLAFISMNSFVENNPIVRNLQANYGSIALALAVATRIGAAIIVVLGFTFLFVFMPYTRVRFWPGFFSALVTTLIWGCVQWAYIGMQVGLTKYNAIYGTFAVLPFFLAWLYANWNVILLGCELSYAIQNRNMTYIDKQPEFLGAGPYLLLGAVALNEICTQFKAGNGAWHAEPFSAATGIPLAHLKRALQRLVEGNLVLEAENDGYGKVGYVPMRPPAEITLKHVTDLFTGIKNIKSRKFAEFLPEYMLVALRRGAGNQAELLSSISFDGHEA